MLDLTRRPFSRLVVYLLAALCVVWPSVLLALVVDHSIPVTARILVICLGAAGAALPILFAVRTSILWWANLPCVLIAPIFAAFVFAYKEPPQNGMWVSLLGTNRSEAAEQISGNWIFALVGLIFMSAYAFCYRYFRNRPPLVLRQRIAITCVAVFVILFCRGGVIPWTYPDFKSFQPVSSDMFYGSFPTGTAVVAWRSISHNNSQVTPAPKGLRLVDHAGRQIVVLIVGETVQYDRWRAAAEDADPAFLSQKDAVVFRNNVSQADFTAWSVPLMLSGDALLSDAHPSWLDFGKNAGFTTAWISTSAWEGGPKNEARVDRAIDLRRDGKHTGALYDADMLAELDELLAGPDQKLCIVLHMIGGHFSYLDRYPPSEAHYPVDASNYNNAYASGYRDAIHAAYANAMLKDIHFVEAVEQRLRAQSGAYSLMIYAPDHGENLFDDNTAVMLHGRQHPSLYELHVPVVIWGSERLRQEESAAWQQITAQVDRPTSNRSIFSTLLWAMGVEGSYSAARGFQSTPKTSDPPRMISFGYELTVPLEEVLTWQPDPSIQWKGGVAGAVNSP